MTLGIAMDRVDGDVPTAVMALDGELDASNFNDVIATGHRLYAEGVRRLVLDLGDLTFLASSGLVALHSLIRIMRGEAPPDPDEGWGAIHSLEFDVSGGAAQHDVQLAAPQAAVDRVLTRTGMKRLFVVHPDRAAALEAV